MTQRSSIVPVVRPVALTPVAMALVAAGVVSSPSTVWIDGGYWDDASFWTE